MAKPGGQGPFCPLQWVVVLCLVLDPPSSQDRTWPRVGSCVTGLNDVLALSWTRTQTGEKLGPRGGRSDRAGSQAPGVSVVCSSLFLLLQDAQNMERPGCLRVDTTSHSTLGSLAGSKYHRLVCRLLSQFKQTRPLAICGREEPSSVKTHLGFLGWAQAGPGQAGRMGAVGISVVCTVHLLSSRSQLPAEAVLLLQHTSPPIVMGQLPGGVGFQRGASPSLCP